MDLNGDGKLDILSGSYSREKGSMAGLFHVLYGAEGGGFRAPAVLNGSDGKPLVIGGDAEDDDVKRICTRPTAVDLDGDGKLDIVSGNFEGSFALFAGEGEGKFKPAHSILKGPDGEPLKVDSHGDPFFCDWDGDGDLDMLSGSGQGGASLFRNGGTKTAPKFAAAVELVPPAGHSAETRLGDEWLKGPQSDTRVWADDLNGDGKLDLLVGDSVTLVYPAKGLDEAAVREKLKALQEKEQKLFESLVEDESEDEDSEKQKKFQKDYQELRKERAQVVSESSTGFVWVFYRK